MLYGMSVGMKDINRITTEHGGKTIHTPPHSSTAATQAYQETDHTSQAAMQTAFPPNPQPNGLGPNPRCLRRDINPYASAHSPDAAITNLILNSNSIASFQDRMQSAGPELRVHLAGHYTVGGDAGSDFFNSPRDPTFWFHHAMIDRVWWIRQNQDLEGRERALAGTVTFLNMPPSRNGTLGDGMGLGNVTNGEAMSTVGGGHCYVYA